MGNECMAHRVETLFIFHIWKGLGTCLGSATDFLTYQAIPEKYLYYLFIKFREHKSSQAPDNAGFYTFPQCNSSASLVESFLIYMTKILQSHREAFTVYAVHKHMHSPKQNPHGCACTRSCTRRHDTLGKCGSWFLISPYSNKMSAYTLLLEAAIHSGYSD